MSPPAPRQPSLWLRTGMIELDVEARKLDLLVESDELEEEKPVAGPESHTRGFARLYQEHVSQANLGCDFDFLLGTPVKPGNRIFLRNHDGASQSRNSWNKLVGRRNALLP